MAKNQQGIAYPYAQAIFKIATKENSANLWLEFLSNLQQICNDKKFIYFLNDPQITNEEILELIKGCFKHKLDLQDKTLYFLMELINNKRLELINHIYLIFNNMLLEAKGEAFAIIESAYSITQEQQASLEHSLSVKFNKKIKATVTINPDLIAGIRVTINDKEIDYSIKGKLTKLANMLH